MTEKDMTAEFLNWEDSPSSNQASSNQALRAADVPVSQLTIIPTPKAKPRHEDRGEPKYINPEKKEPTIQTPDVQVDPELIVPLKSSPNFPDLQLDRIEKDYDGDPKAVVVQFSLEVLTTEQYRDLHNGTKRQIKDLSAEDLQKLRHRMVEQIEKIRVQLQCVVIEFEGKVSLVSPKKRTELREDNASFYAKRGKRAPSDPQKAAATSAKKAANDFEKGIQQMVRMKMDETTIRKMLRDMGTEIPVNLTAIISQFQLKG